MDIGLWNARVFLTVEFSVNLFICKLAVEQQNSAICSHRDRRWHDGPLGFSLSTYLRVWRGACVVCLDPPQNPSPALPPVWPDLKEFQMRR